MLLAGSMHHFCGREVHEEKVVKISPLSQTPADFAALAPHWSCTGRGRGVSTGGSSSSRLLLGRPDVPVQAGPVSTPRQRGRAGRRALIRLEGISVQV